MVLQITLTVHIYIPLQNPSWGDERLEFSIEVPESEELDVMLFDRDSVTEDDFLGQAKISTAAVLKRSAKDRETWSSLFILFRLQNISQI